MSTEDSIHQLEQAIAALEAQRGVLGDAVVEAALGPMREKLAVLQTSATKEEQRKLVTVLFADLVDFTALSERLDPEEVHQVQQAYFTAVTRPIREQGGWIEKYIGDAVVAVFGLPKALENDPDRALSAALAMQAALAELNQDLEQAAGVRLDAPLQMRVGVNTGLVLVSQVSGDFDVTGDAVNLAARLQTAAPPGGVLISQDTYRHVRGAFDLLLLEPIQVKGKSEPVQVYRALGSKPRSFRTRKRGVEGIETRMIGRESELQALQNAFFAAIEDGECQQITVVGEPGLGKSRLLYEFSNWVDLRPEGVVFFSGRARQETQRLPYSLLRDLFAFRFAIQDDDPLSVVWSKVEAGFAGINPPAAPGQVGMPAHFIGQLIGYDFSASPHIQAVKDDPQQIRDRGLVYLVNFIASMARSEPLLILMEDLHWADDSSLDAVARLSLALQERPLLIVATARSTLYERRPHWMEGQDFHQRIDLQQLSKRDSRRLVEEVLQKAEEIPENLRELLISNAEGNPFYIEELIKMLVEDGVIVTGEDRWQVRPERLGQAHIPATLTGVLQARLDGLPEAERVVLQQASVIGRVFWDKALAYLNQPGEAGLQPDEVERMLSALRTKEMVFQRDFSAFTGVGEHIFKHSLLREVTYESVLKRLRRLYHGLAADWLLAQGGQRARELNGIIANHLEMAGRNSDALAFLTRAGEEAQASYANREAIEYYSHALALVPRSEVELRSDLLLRREELYNRLGEREAEKNDLHALNQLLAEFPVGSEATFVAELKVKIAFRLANYDFLVSNYELAEQEAEEAAALAQALGAPAMAIKCYSILAVIANHQSKYEIALQRAQEGLALARESGDREGISRMLNILGTIAMEQADLSAGRAFLEESLSILDASSDRRYVINTRGNLAMLAGMAGDFSAALAEYQAVTSLNREVGDRAGEANSSGNLAWVYGLIGDYHSAYQYARLHRQICIEINRILEEIVALVNMSSFARLLGDLPAARQHAENGVELSLKLQSPYWHAWSLTVLGHVLCEQGEPGEAGQVYQQALAIRRQLNQPSLALEPLAGLARVALAQANLAEAMAHCEEILAYLEQGGTLDGADEPLRVLLTAVQALQAAGDRRAAATLDQAHTRLVDQAARIRDEPSRKSYLENVPWHNEILRLWQADQDSPQGD